MCPVYTQRSNKANVCRPKFTSFQWSDQNVLSMIEATMQTFLITGGAGFIGSCLVRQLVARRDVQVVNLDLLTYAGSRASLEEVQDCRSHTFVQGDIADAQCVAKLLAKHQPTIVVHLAAESHVDRSIDSPRRFVETNIAGTFALLEETHNYWRRLPGDRRDTFRFVHVSTDEVFGSLGEEGLFHEHSPYTPNSPYAASKASSDHLVRAYHRTYGLPTIIANSSNNYGPYQFPEKLVPLMTLAALDRKPLPIYGNGSQVRDWLHVDDHAKALHLIATKGRPGEAYCVGGDRQQTNLEVVYAICDAVDKLHGNDVHTCRKLIDFVADRPGHDQRYAVDSSKIHEQLGWRPAVEFAIGLEETVGWYAANRSWASEVTQGVYSGERLGLRESL